MPLSKFLAGEAAISEIDGGWRLQVPASRAYVDAQLDDTQHRGRGSFAHRPPLEFSLEARAASASPRGTLGFGFWNDPFPSVGGQAGAERILPAAPQALWFFHGSAESDLPFAPGSPGSGWRAASLRTPGVPPAAVAIAGAGLFVGLSIPALRRPLVRAVWRAVEGAQSPLLPGLDQWHAYQIEWTRELTTFRVNSVTVLEVHGRPSAPLGLVIWIDNQWAVFSESRGLRFGVCPTTEAAWLEVRRLRLNGAPLSLGPASPPSGVTGVPPAPPRP